MTDEQKQELEELVSDLSKTVSEAVEPLRKFDMAARASLQEALQSIGHQVDLVLQAASPQAVALSKQCLDIQADMQSMVVVLDTARQGADSAVGSMESKLEEWESARNDVREAFDDTLTGASTNVDGLLEAMEDALDATTARFEEFQQQIAEHIAEKVLAPITEMQDECVERIEDLIEEIVEKTLPDKAEQVTGEWITELNEEITLMMDRLQTGLDEFRDTIISGSDAAQGSRQTSEQALDMLRTAFAPVLDQLDRVRGLAGTVGISI